MWVKASHGEVQGLDEGNGRLKASLRFLGQQAAYKLGDLRGNVRAQVRQRLRFSFKVLGEDFHRSRALKRRPPREREIEDASQTVQIRADIDVVAASCLFGRHVLRRTDANAFLTDGRRLRSSDGEKFRQSEIDHLDEYGGGIVGEIGLGRGLETTPQRGGSRGTGARKEKVGRLDVSMDDAVFVSELQGECDLAHDGADERDRQRLLLDDELLEVQAVHILHGEPEDVVGLVGVVSQRDVGVSQPRDRRHFAEEEIAAAWVLRRFRRNDFYGRHAIHHSVDGLVDSAEAPFAQLVKNAILAQNQPAGLAFLNALELVRG